MLKSYYWRSSGHSFVRLARRAALTVTTLTAAYALGLPDYFLAERYATGLEEDFTKLSVAAPGSICP